VVETRAMRTVFDEDAVTKEYMCLHGIDNVRGGSYTKLHLDDTEKELLGREIAGATDRCFTCGGTNHFTTHCSKVKKAPSLKCSRCLRTSHTASECFAQLDKYGRRLQNTDTCFRCGRSGHWVSNCYARSDVYGNRLY
jgi:hypothetical protein